MRLAVPFCKAVLGVACMLHTAYLALSDTAYVQCWHNVLLHCFLLL